MSYNYSPRASYRLLSLARPGVCRRNEAEIRSMLEGVSRLDIARFLVRKPRASTIYLGSLQSSKRGIALKIDRMGRVNAEWVEIPSVMRAYEERNLLASVLSPVATAA